MFITSFHGIKKARLRRDGLEKRRADECESQVARWPTPFSPAARPVPYGVTDSRRTKYSVVDTTWVHFDVDQHQL